MKDKILEIIAEQFNMDVNELDEDMNFQDDLNADSIELVELVMTIEEEFDTEVSEDDLDKLKTVGDVIDYVEDLEQ
ncbi:MULTISPECIES: acyl carrier protein [Peptoniphilus]|mgnify:FL=1|jgi:acyl carrier protein|uniref:acyl carrier protein n=1 Tax=Peptoniphilus TaxID=162289 RepID=UPI00028A19B9|nr:MULTISPECIES: acyl carrier protein [Peptoniphilus]MBS6610068.1 acyl carrier protein [Peptoniphilus harei]MDU1043444.1 acyl carrier protein [Peptoniphilus rhinitidis]MDU1954159.1 acyl carrier protein [Peptoniphilus lacydonensis]MDU2110636.1 acyl carrier protein [Peptoniphilus lacydonensis]MDU2115895.1 acyl carrier protein [Peptoniphilus lacydonensis]